jgi:hypothetical protein
MTHDTVAREVILLTWLPTRSACYVLQLLICSKLYSAMSGLLHEVQSSSSSSSSSSSTLIPMTFREITPELCQPQKVQAAKESSMRGPEKQ